MRDARSEPETRLSHACRPIAGEKPESGRHDALQSAHPPRPHGAGSTALAARRVQPAKGV